MKEANEKRMDQLAREVSLDLQVGLLILDDPFVPETKQPGPTHTHTMKLG